LPVRGVFGSLQFLNVSNFSQALIPQFVFSLHIIFYNFQELERNSQRRDLLLRLCYQNIGNEICCWGFVWDENFHFSFIVKGISTTIMDNSELKEVHRFLCRHEEITKANNGALMLMGGCKLMMVPHDKLVAK